LEQVVDEQIVHERSTDYGNWDALMLYQGKDQSVANDFGFDRGLFGEFFAFSNAIGNPKCVCE
jgi:hypothetical protein